MIRIERYVSDLVLSNMYLVREGAHAIVIDPCRDTSPAKGLTVDQILLTHEHYDHISGVALWKKETGAPVLCSQACAENIRSPRKNLAALFREFCELQTWIPLREVPLFDPAYVCEADETFADEMCFDWQGHQWRLFEAPGHSQGSVGIMLDERYFFSGDSLLEHSETEWRLPGGSRRQWREIGEPRLKALMPGVCVYPGHFDSFVLE